MTLGEGKLRQSLSEGLNNSSFHLTLPSAPLNLPPLSRPQFRSNHQAHTPSPNPSVIALLPILPVKVVPVRISLFLSHSDTHTHTPPSSRHGTFSASNSAQRSSRRTLQSYATIWRCSRKTGNFPYTGEAKSRCTAGGVGLGTLRGICVCEVLRFCLVCQVMVQQGEDSCQIE